VKKFLVTMLTCAFLFVSMAAIVGCGDGSGTAAPAKKDTTPAKDTPAKDTPAKDTPAKDTPQKDAPK